MINNPECQVLGSLLCEPSYIFQIQEALSIEDFLSERHKNIFKAIISLGDKADVFTVAEEIGIDGSDPHPLGNPYSSIFRYLHAADGSILFILETWLIAVLPHQM